MRSWWSFCLLINWIAAEQQTFHSLMIICVKWGWIRLGSVKYCNRKSGGAIRSWPLTLIVITFLNEISCLTNNKHTFYTIWQHLEPILLTPEPRFTVKAVFFPTPNEKQVALKPVFTIFFLLFYNYKLVLPWKRQTKQAAGLHQRTKVFPQLRSQLFPFFPSSCVMSSRFGFCIETCKLETSCFSQISLFHKMLQIISKKWLNSHKTA